MLLVRVFQKMSASLAWINSSIKINHKIRIILHTVLHSVDSDEKTLHYSHRIPKLDFWGCLKGKGKYRWESLELSSTKAAAAFNWGKVLLANSSVGSCHEAGKETFWNVCYSSETETLDIFFPPTNIVSFTRWWTWNKKMWVYSR